MNFKEYHKQFQQAVDIVEDDENPEYWDFNDEERYEYIDGDDFLYANKSHDEICEIELGLHKNEEV